MAIADIKAAFFKESFFVFFNACFAETSAERFEQFGRADKKACVKESCARLGFTFGFDNGFCSGSCGRKKLEAEIPDEVLNVFDELSGLFGKPISSGGGEEEEVDVGTGIH